MPDGWTLVEPAPRAAAPPSPSGWTLVEPAPAAPAPGVFRSTNEKDATGQAVVREPTTEDAGRLMLEREQHRTAADRVVTAMPGIGPILAYFTDHPYQWLHDKVDEWGKAGPHAVVQGLTNLYLGNYAKGAHQVATGAAVTAAPMVAPELLGALAAAPVATSTALATGTAATMVAAPPAKQLAVAAGLTEDQAQLVEDAVGLGAGYVGAKATPQNLVTAGKVALSHVPGFRGLRAAGSLIDAAGEAITAQRAAQTAAAASPAATTPPAALTPAEASAARIDQIIQEGLAQGAARAPQMPAPGAPRVTAPTPAPAPAAPAVPASTSLWAGPAKAQGALVDAAQRAGYPLSPAELQAHWPAVQAGGPETAPAIVQELQAARAPVAPVRRWGPAEAQAALEEAAARAGYPISGGELKVARPSVMASGPDAGPAVAAAHVERLQARAPGPAVETPVAVPPAVAPPPSAVSPPEPPAAPVSVVLPPARPAAPASAGVMPMADAPVATVPARTAAASAPGLSGAKAEGLIWQAAERAGIERITPADVRAAAALVQQGQTPEAALRIVQQGGSAPVDPAADLAARLGTPSPAESDAAIDARWRKGELKTPSAPTAARMKADADARLAAAQQPVAAARPAPKRASRRAPKVAAPATPQETEPYRGYLIRRNPVSNEMWVEKDGFRIGGAASAEDAKRTIEMLTAA